MKYRVIIWAMLIAILSPIKSFAFDRGEVACIRNTGSADRRFITQDPSGAYDGLPCFIFSAENIESWSLHEDLLTIRLTQSGREDLKKITREYTKEKVAFFIDEYFYSAPIVMEELNTGAIMVATKEIITALPAEKKRDEEQ